MEVDYKYETIAQCIKKLKKRFTKTTKLINGDLTEYLTDIILRCQWNAEIKNYQLIEIFEERKDNSN